MLTQPYFNKVMIANRGAIACRVIRTLKKLNITSVAVYSEADAESLHVVQADERYSLGSGAASVTYLDQNKLIAIAKAAGVEAIHPGYGFLSENPDFVELCEANGLVFLGPTPEQINKFGLKHSAREIATHAQVPLLPGTGLLKDKQQALLDAEIIGYPVMLKSTAGGGGIGMQRCNSKQELDEAFESVKRLSENNFSNSGVFLEKFIQNARHIEVQIFGDGKGGVVSLGERDCSAQRRNQKVIEETPAPNLDDETREALQHTACRLAQQVNYRNAGTVEYVLDQDTQQFYFLEVNTRLQVEHGVTEEVFGVDLVEWMVALGANKFAIEQHQNHQSKGHAVQVRLYAEDANKNFQPCAGLLNHVQWAEIEGLRVEHWIEAGVTVSPFFDPMLAKIIAYGSNRKQALAKLAQALDEISIYGIEHNQAYLKQLVASDVVQFGEVLTRSLNDFTYQPTTIDVISGGTQTTIQDYPGRKGYWNIGVPPSGPMDSLSFRLANQLLGNDESAAGLEIIISGPTLKFNCDSQIVIAGADIDAKLDGQAIAKATTVLVKAGQTLAIGKLTSEGARSYLCIKGGINCPDYLGSKSTFTLGQFGGHAGRAICAGDVLPINPISEFTSSEGDVITNLPEIRSDWTIRVIYGPHGAPDFFTDNDIATFFAAEWKVHFNSSRTGVRLIGPKPEWARTDGGEAGLHPSNIHDNAYAVGTIDFTGDMPVILGPDGPSLGGFVCPATIIKADLWKMGQLKAGDKLRFVPVSLDQAELAERAQKEQIERLSIDEPKLFPAKITTPIIKTLSAAEFGEQIVYRPSGEDFLLVEYGPQVLDIRLRFRVHALMLKLEALNLSGVEELTPGIRSLQIHYNNLVLPRDKLLDYLEAIESQLENIDELTVPARMVHLPLSWDDDATRLAIKKYDEVVRKNAPWCPDNIEFIRRINGLDSIEDVKKIVFDASYLVMGLGDVYLGAPVATPLDPRHRLVTTKYNPARTWTPENAVGIGGAYMCVYGMEGPGGYQFVGRTMQMWNRYRQTEVFQKPWLLRFFDQIKFYEVSAEELVEIRRQHPLGQYPMKIEETTFCLADYEKLVTENKQEIEQCKTRQQAAFEAERQRWVESGQANFSSEDLDVMSEDLTALSDNQAAIESHVAGNIWQVLIKPGDIVEQGQVVMILEAMKMELEVISTVDGVVESIAQLAGTQVHAGQTLIIVNCHDEQ
jgi:urea carboxylase